jgi:hypothetical protein
MQTTGATLLVVKPCSVTRLWRTAQDSRSVHRLLYLAAVQDDSCQREHCQPRLDIGLSAGEPGLSGLSDQHVAAQSPSPAVRE